MYYVVLYGLLIPSGPGLINMYTCVFSVHPHKSLSQDLIQSKLSGHVEGLKT